MEFETALDLLICILLTNGNLFPLLISANEKSLSPPVGLSAHAHIELPYYSKFLLIAAYLASFNPARTDRRFFLKVYYSCLIPSLSSKHDFSVQKRSY